MTTPAQRPLTPTSNLSIVWRQLTEPSPSLKRLDQRRQAQLLAALLVVILPLGATLEALTTFLTPPSEQYTGYRVTIAALSFLAAAYGLSRTQHFRLAAGLTVVVGSVAVFASALSEASVDIGFFAYLIAPLLLGSLFFTPRQLAWLTAANIAGMLLLPLWIASVDYFALLLGPVGLILIMGSVFTLTTWYRNLLERDRQAELARERNLLRTMIDNLPDSIYAKDRAGRFILDNLADTLAMGAAAPEAVIGKTDFDLYPRELAERYNADDQAVLQSGQPLTREEPAQDAQGKPRWSLTTKVPLRDDQGRIVGLVGIGRDLTERKQMEEALRESEIRYRTLVEQIPAITYLDAADPSNPQGFISLYVSPQFETLLGYSPAEYQADQTLWERLLYPEDRERVLAEDARHYATRSSSTQEYRLVARDGRVLWFRDQCVMRWDEFGQRFLNQGISLDITDLKQTEERVRREAARAEALARIASRLNAQTDLAHVLNAVCEETARVLNIPTAYIHLYDEARDAFVYGGGYNVPPEYPERLRAIPRSFFEQRRVEQEGVTLIADVQTLPDLPNSDLEAQDMRTVVSAAMRRQGAWVGALNIASRGEARAFAEGELALLRGIADQTAQAITNARLYDENLERLENLSALHATSQKLSRSLSLRLLAEDAVRTCVEFFGAQLAWLGYAEPDGRVRLLTQHPREHEYPQQISVRWDETSPEGRGPAGQAFRTGFPVVAADVARDPNFLAWREAALTQGFRSLAAVPLISHDQPFGLLVLYSPQTDYFTPKRVNLLQTYAHQAAAALENARLFEETERRLKYLNTLRNVEQAIAAILDLRVTFNVLFEQLITHLQVDAADVLLLNPATQMLEYSAGHGFRTPAIRETRRRLGEGNAGRAALERRIISLPDLTAADFARAPLLKSEAFVAYFAVPLAAKGEIKGVLEIFRRSAMHPDAEWLDFLEALAGQVAIAVDNITLFERLQRSNQELTLAYDATIEGWSRALDLRDKETEGHTQRVTEMTVKLARAMGLTETELIHVRRGATLHDIGKMGVPDSVLLKPGPLTEDEWRIMRQHPQYAYEMLSPIAYLRPALDIPHYHHERWDGAGYPHGLKGEQIPLAARLFAIVDVWDALRSDRPYRAGWPEVKVREHLRSLAGTHFEPRVVEAFLRVLDSG